jgi:fatty acid-binding protein DegV
VNRRFECAEIHVVEFTPVMGAHTGPGVLGVAFHPASGGRSGQSESGNTGRD